MDMFKCDNVLILTKPVEYYVVYPQVFFTVYSHPKIVLVSKISVL